MSNQKIRIFSSRTTDNKIIDGSVRNYSDLMGILAKNNVSTEGMSLVHGESRTPITTSTEFDPNDPQVTVVLSPSKNSAGQWNRSY